MSVGASAEHTGFDFRAASQTPLSNLGNDGNKNFFSEQRSDRGVHPEVL